MIDIEHAIIRKMTYHRISIDDVLCKFSDVVYENPDADDEAVSLKIFLKPFVANTFPYEFHHEIDINLNPLYKLAQDIFEDGNFSFLSKNIARHLKAESKHPNIKDGDVFIISYDGIKVNNVACKAIGIYKIESKEGFIETDSNPNSKESLQFKQGIGPKRLDKACLIVESEKPFTILLIDNASMETDYWKNDFVKVRLKKDNANSTNQFLTIAKTFVTEQLSNDFEVSKADRIDLLNRSVAYFKKHESFDKQEFEKEVFQEESLIRSFQSYDSSYRQQNEIDIEESFVISQQAVKKQARVFKSVLKLDKNFHIYIHGNRNLIEQGVESDGRKFYKLYFDNET